MIHSTWSDEFINITEAVEPDSLSIWYLGGNGFIVKSRESTIYVDPYFGDGNPPFTFRMIPVPMDPRDATECDAVLVTHEHVDHMHPPSIRPLANRLGAEVYAPKPSFENPEYGGQLDIPEGQRTAVSAGDSLVVGDLTIHVCVASDDDSLEPVTYVIEHDDGTFFHGGDTKPTEKFEELRAKFDIDVGVLALGSKGRLYDPDEQRTVIADWYMDEKEVMETASNLEFDRLVPSHYDLWKGVTADPEVLRKQLHSWSYPNRVDVMEIGDRIDVDSEGVMGPSEYMKGGLAEY